MMPGSSTDEASHSLLTRLGLWRVTRAPSVRRCYDWLSARGIALAQLDLFVRDAGGAATATPPAPPDRVTIETARARDHLPDGLRDAPVAPDDVVVLARRAAGDAEAGVTVGYGCCTTRTVYVPELRRRLDPPGVYVWRVYVDPAERGRGIGTAIVAQAVRHAATESASALVAPDNLPSRRAFRALDFVPTVRYTSAGLGGRTVHRQRSLGSTT